MSDYSKVTNFTAKDGLALGDASKRINGALFDSEFNPISTAIASKIDKVAGETGELAVFTSSGGLESSDILPSIFNTLALQATDMIAGDGITGGGDLSADRTLTLGTPTQLTSSTTDAITTSSHTHSIDLAGFFTGSNQSLTTNGYQIFPGGLIVQWMSAVESVNSSDFVSFPMTFPTACLAAMVTPKDTLSQEAGGIVINTSAAGLVFTGGKVYNSGNEAFVMAIGY
jgi:hypothetical protein